MPLDILSPVLGVATAPLALLGSVTGGTGAGPAGAAPGGAAGPVGATGVGGVLGTVVDTVVGVALTPLNLAGQVLGAASEVANIPANLASSVLGGGGANGAAVDLTGFGRGNGRTANRTIIETLDLATMVITRVVKSGTPFMMNSDRRAAKRVFRQSQELHRSLPRKTVHPSKMTQLKNASIEAAMQAVHCPTPRLECK